MFSGCLILFIKIFISLISLAISLLLWLMSTALSTKTLSIARYAALLLSILSSLLRSSSLEHSYAPTTAAKMTLLSPRYDHLTFRFPADQSRYLPLFHKKDSFDQNNLLLGR